LSKARGLRSNSDRSRSIMPQVRHVLHFRSPQFRRSVSKSNNAARKWSSLLRLPGATPLVNLLMLLAPEFAWFAVIDARRHVGFPVDGQVAQVAVVGAPPAQIRAMQGYLWIDGVVADLNDLSHQTLERFGHNSPMPPLHLA
jgi:hypothetical protein